MKSSEIVETMCGKARFLSFLAAKSGMIWRELNGSDCFTTTRAEPRPSSEIRIIPSNEFVIILESLI